MKGMYKDGQYKAVHTCHIEKMLADGWSFKPEKVNVREETKEEKVTEKAKEENLTATHKKALELGLEIYDENGELIHHKTLGKIIKEALSDEDQGPAS